MYFNTQWLRSFFSAPLSHFSTMSHIGKAGEDVAVAFLQKKGIRLVARNWRHKHLEIDIIGEDSKDDNCLVFIEVKTRRKNSLSSPTEAITPQKCRHLIRAAKAWLLQRNAFERPCRFDVVGVEYETKDGRTYFTVEHYDNAFDLSSM